MRKWEGSTIEPVGDNCGDEELKKAGVDERIGDL